MLRIAICDDMIVYAEMLTEIVKKWAVKQQVNIQLKRFSSGEELLADVEAMGDFNIVLLDIELKGGMDGVRIAMEMREMNQNFCLIFISQYSDHYKEAFQAYPFYYLEKPVVREKLVEILDRAMERYWCQNEIYVFRYKKMTYSIRLQEVLYFVSDRRIIQIYMENGDKYKFYGKLDELESSLQGYSCRFLRIHKSYLVNGKQIERFHSKYVIMRNKDMLSVSLEKRSNVIQFHMEILEGL